MNRWTIIECASGTGTRPIQPELVLGWFLVPSSQNGMMHTVGSHEARTHLSRLLSMVAKGESVTITKHGVPVARLVPVNMDAKPEPARVIKDLLEFRSGRKLGKLSLRKMIEEGRRF